TPGRDLFMDRKCFLFPSRRRRSDRATRDRRPRLDALELRTVLSAAALNFVPLPGSVALGSLPESAPFALPPGFTQEVVQSRLLDPDLLANNDMNTLNETGPDAGRYLFTASEVGSDAGVSRTDLWTGDTIVLAQRSDFNSVDPVRWTPWGTLLFGE